MAGAQVQKHFGVSGSGDSAATRGGNRGGAAFANDGSFAGRGGAQDGGAATAGQVLTVHTTKSTPVQVSGTLKNLKPGTTITVEGPASSDGTVTATRISEGG